MLPMLISSPPCPPPIDLLSKLPPEYYTEDCHIEVDPYDIEDFIPTEPYLSVCLVPTVADIEELLRVVRDDTINFFLDAPLHHGLLINGPDIDKPPQPPGITQELGAEGTHERLLEHIERYVGDGEKPTSKHDREANVCDRKGRQVVIAQR